MKALVVVAAVAVSSLVFAGPAAAQSSSCTAHPGTPYKASNARVAANWTVRCSRTVQSWAIAIQQLRWFGWNNVVSQRAESPLASSGALSASCSGFGTRTYRLSMTGFRQNVYQLGPVLSGERRFTC